MPRLTLLLCLPLLAAGPRLDQRLDRILKANPAAQQCFWGVHVVEVRSGRTLYARNSAHFLTPASNTKLFSTALALSRLGPQFRFQTVVLASAKPDASGRLRGDLVLAGGGDPSLSGRLYPYQREGPAVDPLQGLGELASQVAAQGLRVVEGNLVGDDTAFPWEPYPEGWAAQDTVWEYGAPVSALVVNDNMVRLSVRPGRRPGDPARLFFAPPVEPFWVDNRIVTVQGAKTKMEMARIPRHPELRLWGEIAPGHPGVTHLLAVDDPALFAALAFRQLLEARGVVIRGGTTARHCYPGQPHDPPSGMELARRRSPALDEIIGVVNKVSQNLHAEILLRTAARASGKPATREAALEELERFLTEAGIPKDGYRFEDGSGLSRLTLVRPETVTRLLVFMARSPYAGQFARSLPLAGEEGTLHGRLPDLPSGRTVRAKTGTLSHVSGLAGYADTKAGRRLAFSILVNNYRSPSAPVRRMIDSLAAAIADY